MHRWRNCPGSPKLSRGVPNISSRFAEEGTEAHDLAKNILEARKRGKPEPDTFEYEDEMIDMVGVYVDHVIALGKEKNVRQLFEHRFDLSSVYPGCFGTADAVTYYPDTQLLVVTDLKYGAGILVDVRDNDQLKYYALGVVVSLKWPVKTIRLEICQPRTWAGEPVSKWEMDIFELWEFSDELVEAAVRTKMDDTQLVAGDWCRFCPAAAAGICPLVKQQLVSLGSKTLVNFDVPPIDYEQIGRWIKWFPILRGIMTQMTEFAYQHAKKGVKIPGTKLVDKRAHRKWRNEVYALEALSDYVSPKRMVKLKMMSPAEIERISENEIAELSKKEFKKFIADLVVKESSGYALVSEDDDRPEVKPISAKSVFALTDETDAFA